MKLTNNTILITGGTSGIGLALAERLAKTDNQIIILGRNQTKLTKIQQQHPKFATYQADVSQPETLAALPSWLKTHYPKLNIVINSAGTMRTFSLFDESVSVDALVSDVQTNLIGTIAIDKLLINQLRTQPEALIVNISSGLANLSMATHPSYSASKAGVHMFTDALREQLQSIGATHVHVMELVPPMVAETNLESTASTTAPGNMKLPDLIAATLKGMTQDKKRVNPGLSKGMRLAGKIAPDSAEHRLATTMIPQYFPNGLI